MEFFNTIHRGGETGDFAMDSFENKIVSGGHSVTGADEDVRFVGLASLVDSCALGIVGRRGQNAEKRKFAVFKSLLSSLIRRKSAKYVSCSRTPSLRTTPAIPPREAR